jgi:hypothetical protein
VQYEYYDLPFCKRGRSKSKAENLGERLSGDTTTASPYEVSRSSRFLFDFDFCLSVACLISLYCVAPYETR